MVELKGITIGSFKNIDRVNIEIDDMISLLSINSYGKSNCLDAIVFGMDFIRENVETKIE